MPLAVNMEPGLNRGAKATCDLLCNIFWFAFWLWAQQELMKHDHFLPSFITKTPSSWGNSLCLQTQSCPRPPNSYTLPFLQLQCLWKANIWDGDRESHAERCSCCRGIYLAVPSLRWTLGRYTSGGDQSWEKKPARLPALHPGCQRAREDGEDLLTQRCCLLTGYHRFPSPLHLPLPAPVLLLFKATDRDRALQEVRLRLANQRKISSLNWVQNIPAAFWCDTKPSANEEDVIFLSWGWVMLTLCRTIFFINSKLHNTAKYIPGLTLLGAIQSSCSHSMTPWLS